jgi:multidrug resistance efflux pump
MANAPARNDAQALLPSEPTLAAVVPAAPAPEKAPSTPAVSAVSPAPLARVEPKGVVERHAIFREQAVQAYLTSMRESEVLRVAPPWARGILGVATVVVFLLLGSTFIVKVDQTGHGRGVLRVAGGVQGVASQTTGVVLELDSRSGDVVADGALLVKIDSTATKTALLEAEREIGRAERDIAVFVAHRDKEQADRIRLLQQRAGLLQRRAQNQNATAARLRDRVATFDRLAAQGLASTLDKGAAENEFAAAQRGSLELQEQISATRLEIANISADLATELERRNMELQKAKDQRDALAFQLEQTEVRSPHGGRLEALVVKVGDAVAVGTPIARIIPEGAPRQVIVFLPEADRAFLQEGAEVRIELDQLPLGEFGSLRATVARIASDLATPAEITEALGETKLDGPTYRIELEIQDGDLVQKLDKLLRPGSLVTARFVLRTRRLATLLLEPIKSFLD